ncbi:helix-turn-helix transcriptional regulator [Streptomyces griseus]|uniref:helix-turn-helix domain-containing protein n=1 Tax=Streptomyces griseus TaxID=1911 RepID=UPI0013BAAF38|nr:helix-turn-helix transcriptional regulator [Streptomyces griseus]
MERLPGTEGVLATAFSGDGRAVAVPVHEATPRRAASSPRAVSRSGPDNATRTHDSVRTLPPSRPGGAPPPGRRAQAAVAGLCGISTDYLSQIERGRKTPSVDVLARLAAELGAAPSPAGTAKTLESFPPATTDPADTGTLAGFSARRSAPRR